MQHGNIKKVEQNELLTANKNPFGIPIRRLYCTYFFNFHNMCVVFMVIKL